METRQDQIEELALEKITGTVETCLCCCSNCKRETIERLRDDVVRLFDEAINGQGKVE